MLKGRKRRPFRKRIRELDKRIAAIDGRIEKLSSFLERPASAPGRPGPPRRDLRHEKARRPDFRLASFLSTGSFQSVDMRQHERRAARRRRLVFWIIVAVILLGIYLYFW